MNKHIIISSLCSPIRGYKFLGSCEIVHRCTSFLFSDLYDFSNAICSCRTPILSTYLFPYSLALSRLNRSALSLVLCEVLFCPRDFHFSADLTVLLFSHFLIMCRCTYRVNFVFEMVFFFFFCF